MSLKWAFVCGPGIHSFIHSLIHSFIDSLIHCLILPPSIHPSIYLFIHFFSQHPYLSRVYNVSDTEINIETKVVIWQWEARKGFNLLNLPSHKYIHIYIYHKPWKVWGTKCAFREFNTGGTWRSGVRESQGRSFYNISAETWRLRGNGHVKSVGRGRMFRPREKQEQMSWGRRDGQACEGGWNWRPEQGD